MFETKYSYPQFAFYDRTGIQRYLERQAEKGWLLTAIGPFAWKFRKTAPRKLRFAVAYFPKADMYDPEPGEEEQTFREFCAHGGWTLAASAAQMQVFYSEAEDPTPIETDPVMEVENIHASMRKSGLLGYWVLLGMALLNGFMLCWSFRADPLVYLSSNLNLFMIVFVVFFLILSAGQLLRYFRWLRRARKAANEDGVFVETRDNQMIQTLFCILLLITILAILATMEDRRKGIVMTVSMLMTVITIVSVVAFRNKMKRDGYDAKSSRAATVIACVVVSVALSLVGNGFAGQMMNSDAFNEKEENLPLYIRDLLGEGEYEVLAIRNEHSLLLDFYDTSQVPVGAMMTPRIQYEAVRVKVPALYELCLEEMLDVPEWIEGAEFNAIDPEPWGAEKAWQLRKAEGLERWYVLCYADTIVEFMPDWELSDAEKAIVGEKFG